MSGTKKPSPDTSKEVEIPLDVEQDEIQIDIKPNNPKREPDYYECDNDYSVFEE